MPKTIYIELPDSGCKVYEIEQNLFRDILDFYKSILPPDHRRNEIAKFLGIHRTTLLMRERALGVYKPYQRNNGRRKKVR